MSTVIACKGNCGKNIYWDTSANQYKESDTNQKHICPNYKKSSNTNTNTSTNSGYKKPFIPYKPKEPVECSVRLVTNKIDYETLSDQIRNANGKIHGVQSHIIRDTDFQKYALVVFFEVPIGKRDLIK